MLNLPLAWDQFTSRNFGQGDVLCLKEIIPATNTTTAITATGAMLAQSIMQRTTTANGTPTIDTAANIIAFLEQTIANSNNNGAGVDDGLSWRLEWIQNAAYTDTLTATAHTGITVVNGVVNASSIKTFLVQVTCGAAVQQVGLAIVTNSSAVVTGMSLTQTAKLRPGMVVTNAQNGLQDAKILSVQPGVGVTLDTTATSGQTSGVSLTFSPTITITGMGQKLL